ncbi:hypothetical protein FHG64_03950 [Antarcticibacterium flavum]|uniref:Uncharacterized protein n=1 Tax=Antarcticibacterium flavum TaxID=2058175 RepID=A0A5B7X1Y4_9FLAO|nr:MULTISPECIES: hypothetical protein [Antarcticibacterium]QCY68613.1 hypothetical protein FHG64_03950 [Antarcticibacterium flavum]
MKKVLFFPLIAMLLIGCSVDNEELDFEPQQILEKNAVFEVEGCETQSLDFNDSGEIYITNDDTNLYITISAQPGNSLSKARLQLGNTLQDFPLVGQGNLPPGQMEHQEDFSPGVDSHTFIFPLSSYEECFYIAANAIFSNGTNSSSLWAGDLQGPKGNWSYFEYCVQSCDPACEGVSAGSNNSTTITESQAAAIPSWDEVRKMYVSLLDPGVPTNGTFDPSIWNMIYDWQERRTGEFTLKYTITVGDCTDSVFLTVNVVPDPE